MKIATWNINSIRAREERLLAFLERHEPEVVCLQETKVQDDAFPSEKLEEAGYYSAINGQRTYNGVAILAKSRPVGVRRGFGDGGDDAQARLVEARVGEVRFVSVYVPNGGEVDSDKWFYKLSWLERLREWLDAEASPDEPLVVAGDFNVAPDPRDVENPESWEESVLFHPKARAALAGVVSWGLVDSLRLQTEESGLYSWWDYRRLAFPKNDGLRIDHLYVTSPLADVCEAAWIERDERKGKKPSDHVPVIADLRV